MNKLQQFIKILTRKKVNTMKQGTVKFYNRNKGFGFIKPTDAEDDIFVHSTGLIDPIHENDSVSYDMQRGDKGQNAVNVRLIK
jgi:CspA family cold shock protein